MLAVVLKPGVSPAAAGSKKASVVRAREAPGAEEGVDVGGRRRRPRG